MRIFVTGASGLLGQYVTIHSLALGHETFAATHDFKPINGNHVTLDLLDHANIHNIINAVKPDAVIHCAAISDIEFCESNRDNTLRINTLGTEAICDSISKNCFFLYISTDNVFDGNKGMYSEMDKRNPVNWYGETKLRAEDIVQKKLKNWTIARISTQYGIHQRRGNLGQDFIKRFVSGQKVRAATDFYSSPTNVESTASMLLEIVERKLDGIIHVCDSNRISRYNFALMLSKLLGSDSKGEIEAISIKDLNWKANRPKDSSLDNLKAKKILHVKPLTLEKGLQTLVKRFLEKSSV